MKAYKIELYVFDINESEMSDEDIKYEIEDTLEDYTVHIWDMKQIEMEERYDGIIFNQIGTPTHEYRKLFTKKL